MAVFLSLSRAGGQHLLSLLLEGASEACMRPSPYFTGWQIYDGSCFYFRGEKLDQVNRILNSVLLMQRNRIGT